MAKQTNITFGPRMLCLYHGDGYWRHAVAWMEYRAGEAPATTVVGAPVKLHVVCTNASGRVTHVVLPASEARYVYPTTVRTTVAAFVAYLCRRLLTVGGNAWEALGVERPITVTASEEGGARPMSDELAEAYERASRLLGTPLEELEKKYSHLNNGLQIMNLRNRLRAKGHNT